MDELCTKDALELADLITKKSKVKVFVIPANEELVIARETCRLLAS